MTQNDDATEDFLAKLEKARNERQQRQMVNLDINEVSGVSAPAHMVEGWLVAKAKDDPHQHRTDSDYLDGAALAQARHWLNADTIPANTERPINPVDKSRTIGRSNCGCVYLKTPESIARAVGRAYVSGVTKSERRPTTIFTPEQAAWLQAEIDKLGGA